MTEINYNSKGITWVLAVPLIAVFIGMAFQYKANKIYWNEIAATSEEGKTTARKNNTVSVIAFMFAGVWLFFGLLINKWGKNS